jgi:hypothetical protein
MPRLGNKYNIGYFFSDQLSCILSDIVGSAELEELKGDIVPLDRNDEMRAIA